MHKRMTREEAEASIAGLHRKIERYAELAVKKARQYSQVRSS